VAESDEHLYHELLIHPACALLPKIRSALVLGGGDGCAARELLKYRELENLHIIEIDQMVVELCRVHFKEINSGALDDPRTIVVIQEGESYLRENPTLRYDLIVADLTEPYDLSGQAGDLSRHIFSTAFYDFIKSYLSPGGILVIQTGGLSHVQKVDRHHKSIIEVIRGSFTTVETAYKYVHSFDQIWSITLVSDHPYDISGLDPDPVLRDKGIRLLKYYDRISHEAVFQEPRHIREFLKE
jgi:spermidine synthase